MYRRQRYVRWYYNLEAIGNDSGPIKTTRLYPPFWWYLFRGGAGRYHHFGGTSSRPFKSAFLKSRKRVLYDTGLGARIPTVAAERKHGIRHCSLWKPLSVSKIGPGTVASAAAYFRCPPGKHGPGRKSSTRISGVCLLEPPPGAPAVYFARSGPTAGRPKSSTGYPVLDFWNRRRNREAAADLQRPPQEI